MRIISLALALTLHTSQIFAQSPSVTEESFCTDRQDSNFIKNLALDQDNLMSFRNRGGIGNGGVCWWHTRFQRNALYLTLFKPELARPNFAETIDLIKQIRNGKNVVIIPGYKNFYDFSSENKEYIQTELEEWQINDGVVHFAWMDGLAGRAKLDALKLKAIMDDIYIEVEVNKNIAYNKLQAPGILAHAWSVLNMKKTDDGYDLEILDSNSVGFSEHYKYYEGDQFLIYHADHAEVTAETLKNLMDQAYSSRVIQKNFLKPLTFPGFEFHRWTASNIVKVQGGYNLNITVYANQKTQSFVYEYRYGDRAINYSIYLNDDYKSGHGFRFVPYLEKLDEMSDINYAIAKYCIPNY